MRSGAWRRAAEAEVELLGRRYRKVIEGGRDVIALTDAAGTVIHASDSLRRVLGIEPAEAVGLPLAERLHPDDVAIAAGALAAILAEPGASRQVEIRVRHRDGHWVWLEVMLTNLLDDPDVGAISSISRDVSRRKAAEEAGRTLAGRVAATMEFMADGFVALDRAWRYIYVNRRAAEMLGRKAEDLIGQVVWEVFPEAVGRPVHRACERVMTGGGSEQIETCFVPRGRWYDNRIYATADGVSIYFQDISARKRAEEDMLEANVRMQALSARVMRVQEEERRHVAHELHDEVGQALTALKISLQGLVRNPAAGPLLATLGDCVAIADDLLGRVRNLSLDLRPAQLDDLGLAAALKWNLGRLARTGGLAFEFAGDDVGADIPELVGTACYRIGQEAITNVLRHAGASEIRVELRRVDDALHLAVSDDGAGFDVAEARRRARAGRSVGLLGMEERALAVGGRFGVESIPGGGTRIRAVLPLATDNMAASEEKTT